MLKSKLCVALILCFGLAGLVSSCNDDSGSDSTEYTDWREQNVNYIETLAAQTENGEPIYTKVQPDWAPGDMYALIKWHNDRSVTEANLSPIDNSTIQMVYELLDINGERLGSSYANTDSIYTCRPNQNIIGVWAALTNIHEGDSVTVVVPYQAGYGSVKYGDILPYSTLTFNLRLKKVTAYEIE